MLYLETVEDGIGDVLEYVTYCAFHTPNPNNAWPGGWEMPADCATCGIHLDDGSAQDEGSACAHGWWEGGRYLSTAPADYIHPLH